MTDYLVRRLVLAAVTLVVAVALIFLAVRTLPTNPILARMGQHAVPERVQEEMAKQGWDRPLYEQLGVFFKKLLLEGDLGESFFNPGERVSDALRQRVPATIELALAALVIAIPLGIVAGVAAAVWRGGVADYLCISVSMLGVSVPVFFLGICLISIFTFLPTGGQLPIGAGHEPMTGFVLLDTLLRGRFDLFAAALRHLALPALALSSIPMSTIARITRSSMLEVLSADYIRTARAKGAGVWQVVWRHAFPNAALPVANIAGFQVGLLLTGAVLTETVFSWPGLGRYVVDAVKNSDYAVVQGGALVMATVFVFSNLAIDILFVWLDPRVRLS